MEIPAILFLSFLSSVKDHWSSSPREDHTETQPLGEKLARMKQACEGDFQTISVSQHTYYQLLDLYMYDSEAFERTLNEAEMSYGDFANLGLAALMQSWLDQGGIVLSPRR